MPEVVNVPFTYPLSATQFCKVENISLQTFHKMKHAGTAPEFTYLPGTNVGRLSRKNHLAWRVKVRKAQNSKAMQAERAARSAQTKRAGLAAAASLQHVSKARTRKHVQA